MISLFPLRPVQIVDISFQLMQKKFIKSLLIAISIALPLQAIVWIFEISATDRVPGEDLTGRTIFIVLVVQFIAVGISLTGVSNLLSSMVGKVYSQTIFNNLYKIHKSPAKMITTLFQVGLQIVFGALMLGFRFTLGQFFTDITSNILAYLTLIVATVPWALITLRLGFSVPVSTHEGGTFSEIRARTKQINKVHFYKLFGVYCIAVLMIILLVSPSLTVIQIFIAKNLTKSSIGNWALFNLVISIVVASIATVYSYMLTATYFNARIEHEGFDIAVAIQQQELAGSTSGKLLNTLSR